MMELFPSEPGHLTDLRHCCSNHERSCGLEHGQTWASHFDLNHPSWQQMGATPSILQMRPQSVNASPLLPELNDSSYSWLISALQTCLCEGNNSTVYTVKVSTIVLWREHFWSINVFLIFFFNAEWMNSLALYSASKSKWFYFILFSTSFQLGCTLQAVFGSLV